MSLRNSPNSYGSITKFFHWGIALVVYCMIAVGYLQQTISNEATQDTVYNYHMLCGLTILLLMVMRGSWRLSNPRVPLPSTVPGWQQFIARAIHFLLYLSLFLMPLSGWVMATASGYPPKLFGMAMRMPGIHLNKALADQAESVHGFIAIVLLVLIGLHMLAAIKHHVIDKDNVLKRMLPSK
ncbi:MAG: cytochrome b [Coxiellaceae bacterium]|nr:cytochrome b [Coxiellaceae bacterium]